MKELAEKLSALKKSRDMWDSQWTGYSILRQNEN